MTRRDDVEQKGERKSRLERMVIKTKKKKWERANTVKDYEKKAIWLQLFYKLLVFPEKKNYIKYIGWIFLSDY